MFTTLKAKLVIGIVNGMTRERTAEISGASTALTSVRADPTREIIVVSSSETMV